jgi:hypothetical protein
MRAKAILAVCLAAVVHYAVAQSRSWGSWFYDWSNQPDFLYAATINDSEHLLGQYCYVASGQCLYLLGIATACTEGNEYPLLVNSNVGSLHAKVLCSGQIQGRRYRYVFTDFDQINDIVKRASKAGFAIALESDQFIVVRFDLIGSNEAIAAMRSGAERNVPTRRGTRDQRL